jgi:hypothetical protein
MESIAEVRIPDSALAAEATTRIRETAGPVLFDHGRRVFLFGTLVGRCNGVVADPELLYVAALFHDYGLTEALRGSTQRFEMDGADAARDLLLEAGYTYNDARTVWLAIALHTTPAIPGELEPEIALLTAGSETDLLGKHLSVLREESVEAILTRHPRADFEKYYLTMLTEGVKHRPATTFGTRNEDVLARLRTEYSRSDFVESVIHSAWPQ